jgi:acylglycerol lipase
VKTGEGTFTARDGLTLFERWWLPDGDPRAVIALVHGYAEHSGRYEHVGRTLAAARYATYSYDLRGHGRSEGPRVYVRSFNEHLRDLAGFLRIVRERQPELPLFLLGHSMGGTIATLFAITRAPALAGLVLSGPGLRRRDDIPAIIPPAVSLLARVIPKAGLFKLDAAQVSRDPDVVRLYDEDPLVYRGRVPLGSAAAAGRAVARIQRDMEKVSVPLLIMHGTADGLTTPAGSQALYERASSSDKTLRLYEGLYHEIFNEPERVEVIGDLIAWLDARTPG